MGAGRSFLLAKWLLFPGIDVATRKRLRLTRHFLRGPVVTLDAGCGNGAFSLAAWRKGSAVLGIDVDVEKVKRCEVYRDFVGIPADRCRFLVLDVYDAEALDERFDQIICFETLEHLLRDADALRSLIAVLKPGGVVHLCTPVGRRALSYGERLSTTEDGGHVRPGYTFEQLETLLHPLGCRVVVRERVVGAVSRRVNDAVRWLIARPLGRLSPRWQETLAVAAFLVLYPLTALDALVLCSPLCVYVQAEKIARVSGPC
jgi:SAM-dependent methyltransferase